MSGNTNLVETMYRKRGICVFQTAVLKRCVGFLIGVVASLNGAAQAMPSCFRRDDTTRAPFAIFQIAKPPRFEPKQGGFEESSPFYPGTAFATTSLDVLNTPEPSTSGKAPFQRYYLHWVNRCIFIPGVTPSRADCRNTLRSKGNNYVGMPKVPFAEQVRPLFSTYRRADACTRDQIVHALQLPSGEADHDAVSAGLTLVADGRDQSRVTGLSRSVVTPDGRQQTALVDTCILALDSLAHDVSGIVLDYEVFDDRSPQSVLQLFSELHRLTRQAGKTLIVNTNPLPRAPNGLVEENIRKVLAEVDGLAPTLASGASMGNEDIGLAAKERSTSPWQSYLDQLSLLTASGHSPLSPSEKAKLIWNVSLFDLRQSEAKQMYDEVIREKYAGIMIARNFVKPGGSCSRPENQVIACLSLGICSGEFGLSRN